MDARLFCQNQDEFQQNDILSALPKEVFFYLLLFLSVNDRRMLSHASIHFKTLIYYLTNEVPAYRCALNNSMTPIGVQALGFSSNSKLSYKPNILNLYFSHSFSPYHMQYVKQFINSMYLPNDFPVSTQLVKGFTGNEFLLQITPKAMQHNITQKSIVDLLTLLGKNAIPLGVNFEVGYRTYINIASDIPNDINKVDRANIYLQIYYNNSEVAAISRDFLHKIIAHSSGDTVFVFYDNQEKEHILCINLKALNLNHRNLRDILHSAIKKLLLVEEHQNKFEEIYDLVIDKYLPPMLPARKSKPTKQIENSPPPLPPRLKR